MIDRGYLSNDYIQDLHPSEYERELDLYNRLLKHSPRLREFLDTLHEMKDYDGVEDVGKMLQRIASQAKSSDAHEVSTRIIGYIPRTPSDDDRLIPPIDAKNKDLRGLNHPDIAALLAPRDLHKHLFLPRTDKRYKRAVAKMMKKKINLYSLHLPKFLYGRCVPTGRSIFTTPSSALRREDRESAKGNDTQMNIHYVTAGMICYVAYHIRHALVVSDTWDQDDKFNYAEFFHCAHTLLTGSFFDTQDYLDAVSKEVPRLDNEKDLSENELLEHREKSSELIIETDRVRHAAWQQDVFVSGTCDELFGCASGRGRHRGSDDDGAMPGEGAAIAALLNRASSPDEDEEEEDDDDDDDFFSAKRALDGEDDDDDLYYDPDGTPHRRPRKDGADNDNGGNALASELGTANDGNTDA
ncbi:hypothetical protein AAF712_009806 [Marasmius tenuissimus]|uniref:Uncharacterized protein n=1 Tax=Marasmius tenuissimus TaxID=585030 RepID=A0ABR2ZP19_9AGAR